MLELSYNLATDVFGLTGLLSHIVASLICTFVLTVFVLVVGSLVNLFESFQMRCLRKFFSRKTVLVICNYVTFVGTVIHELSHAFMAWAMGTKITEVRVFEIRDDNRLGHVNFKATGSKTQQRLQYTLCSCHIRFNSGISACKGGFQWGVDACLERYRLVLYHINSRSHVYEFC